MKIAASSRQDDRKVLAAEHARIAFAGDGSMGVKISVIRYAGGLWRAVDLCHPLDVPGAEERMTGPGSTERDGLKVGSGAGKVSWPVRPGALGMRAVAAWHRSPA